MLLFIPYEIETLQQERPWVNWGIITACGLMALGIRAGQIPEQFVEPMVLTGWDPAGLLGHMLLHGGLWHLLGNMIFLWVFGNAICTNVGNAVYAIFFVLVGVTAAAVHLVADGSPAIGASGAINGVVGMVLAMYPLNRVYVAWVFTIRGGTFDLPAWVLILTWLAFDAWGAFSGRPGVAYWAHIGGLLGGVGFGLILLKTGVVQLTQFDNDSLLDLLGLGEK